MVGHPNRNRDEWLLLARLVVHSDLDWNEWLWLSWLALLGRHPKRNRRKCRTTW